MEPAASHGCPHSVTPQQCLVKATTPGRRVRQERVPEGPPVSSLTAAGDHRARSPEDRVSSACRVHGTRKVVNYTIRRRSHGKLWWKSVAVLTCKLCSLSVA